MQWISRRFADVGSSWVVGRFHSTAELDPIWQLPGDSTERLHGRSPAAESAFSDSSSRRRLCSERRQGDGHAELAGGLGGAEDAVLRSCFLTATTGGTAVAEDAGVDGTGRHRRPYPAKRPCGDQDKEEEQ
jgi:hypothetical protein